MIGTGAVSGGGPAAAFLSRREVLRLLFVGAAGGVARAWAGVLPLVDPDLPVTAVPASLRHAGPLVDSGIDGIRIPQGFGLRIVARHLFNPVSGRFDPLGVWGYPWHKAPDGGACFPDEGGGWTYVSNCESNSAGGVGALRFDAQARIVDAYRLLDGTRRNCAGGATPWGTWLSCEEVEDGRVFECDPFDRGAAARVRPALGLFNHEAAAVHLPSRSVFLTEDAPDGRLYRFVADIGATDRHLDLARGHLQVLSVAGCEDGALIAPDTTPRPVGWLDAIDPGSPQARVRATLRESGKPAPGTAFRGAEGIWVHAGDLASADPVLSRDCVFFACKGDNRIYALDLERQTIEPIFDGAQIDPPIRDVDNLIASPAGDLIVAEDGPATRLVVVQPGQAALVLLIAGHEKSELTGLAFSPDGSRLYFSSQRGPNLHWLPRGTGVTYELLIPPAFRAPRSLVRARGSVS
jgi:uncharacterized protein